MILLTNVLFSGISGSFGIPAIIDVVLAIGLTCGKEWARFWVLIRATVSLFLVVTVFFRDLEPVVMAFSSTMQVLCCASLLLILAGQPRLWRYVLSGSGLAASIILYTLCFMWVC
jgi:hypothetical protein